MQLILLLLSTLRSIFRSRSALELEILALRHQIAVLQRAAGKRPRLTPADRLFWVVLCRLWDDWRSALAIVKPETVIAWHRKGFRLFWTWKVRRGRPGRPAVAREVRDLIRRMSRENPLWGAPHIHAELRKLGIEIGETSVGKYLVRRRKPPSQTWRTFLRNHVKTLVSVVGSRTGAVLRRSDLSVAPRFLWECLTSPTVSPFPAPATSHPACEFPALGAPVCFAARFMRPIVQERLSALA